MLQYSVQLPPLSLSSSKNKNKAPLVHREPRQSDLDPAYRSPVLSKRIDKRPAYAHSIPLAISTAYPPSPSLQSSSQSDSLPPTPIFSDAALSPALRSASPLHTPAFQSKPVPRSPYSQPMPVPTPVRSLMSIPLPSPSLSNAPTSAFGRPVSSFGSYQRSSSGSPSSFSSSAVDVLAPGDLVGEGLLLQNEVARKVPIAASVARPASEEPAPIFEVVRLLGTGSYAVVYLVREVLYRAPVATSDDGMDLDMSMDDHSVRDLDVPQNENQYGREYAIKVLSKGNLNEEDLSAQMFEATIHQSLPLHANIVALHRTLETPSYLLLLLEFVPGEDLFYFLEQARDHYEPSDPVSGSPGSDSGCSVSSESSARTPPTPSLLSNLSPSKLLSRTRLKLIASMFGQMCDAVAVCHERGVFHRDIKPENFIVTDGWHDVPADDGSGQMRRERRVVVKLSDFGLSTTDVHSADMDCGSAPYMSYECRNNIHPTYKPRAADVWSLGIVLINMLYHYNPWTDTTEGVCPSFTVFRQNPVQFFLARFAGMTPAVADFLARRVFCILPDHENDAARVSARDFGLWVKDLPNLLAPPTRPQSSVGHGRSASFNMSVSIADVHGHRLVSLPHSRRPSLRSAAGSRNPSLLANQRASWALSRAPSLSLGPAPQEQENVAPPALAPSGVGLGISMLASVPDQEMEDEHEDEHADADAELGVDAEAGSRSASTQKRRKRGARKGKGKEREQQKDATLATLAMASQELAREISYKSRPAGPAPLSANVSMFNTTAAYADGSPITPTNAKPSPMSAPAPVSAPTPAPAPVPAPTPTPVPVPVITKKPSKWRLGFGKGSSSSSTPAVAPPLPQIPQDAAGKTVNVNNVASLLDSLNAQGPGAPSTSKLPARSPYQHAPPAAAASSTSFASHATGATSRYSANSSMVSLDEPGHGARGRRNQRSMGNMGEPDGMWGSAIVSAFANSGPQPASNVHPSPSPYAHVHAPSPLGPGLSASSSRQRGVSPAASVSASVMSASTTSSNWRSSMSSNASGSSSAFTSYSNGSVRSVSTQATSVSSTSWRSGKSAASGGRHPLPANVKYVEQLPWELGEVPRQQFIHPETVQFSQPPQPQRKRAQKPKNASGLDTISERPPQAHPAASSTELERAGSSDGEDGASPRKVVQKGQINALAKMLSALRR